MFFLLVCFDLFVLLSLVSGIIINRTVTVQSRGNEKDISMIVENIFAGWRKHGEKGYIAYHRSVCGPAWNQ